jgi:hypothetical protein
MNHGRLLGGATYRAYMLQVPTFVPRPSQLPGSGFPFEAER